MQSRESRKYIIFCSKLSNGKVAIVWKTLTVLNANARSALGAPGQTAAFRIAVRLLSVTIILSLEIPLVVSAISDPIRHPVPKSVLVAECQNVTSKTEAGGFETANYADVAFSYLIRILTASSC